MNILGYFGFTVISGMLLIPIMAGFSATIDDYHPPMLAWLGTSGVSGFGLIMNRYALQQSHKKFMMFFAGGLLLRMMILGIAVVAIYSLIQDRMLSFALSFGVFLVLYQAAEVAFLLKFHRDRKKNNFV